MPSIDQKRVYVAGLFDMSNLDWGKEIFDFTISLINDHDDGWFDDVLNDGTILETTVADAACDPKVSLQKYWDLRTHWGKPLHAVIGCRCSGATAAAARVAGLEGVPFVSHVSSSSDLSDTLEFPSLFRLVGPDDGRGQVGALVNFLRSMGWDRVSVLATDTKYTKDLAAEFGNEWERIGDVRYSHTIALDADGNVDEESVRLALDEAPTDDPRVNSRVFLLLAHHQHAYPILKMAQRMKFQPDTIWVGTAAWSDRLPPDGDTSWMPGIPGYLGLVPFRDREGVYEDFLGRLQAKQRAENRTVMESLPDYSAEMMVDSILALAMALSAVSPEQRSDGRAVLAALQDVSFSGVSGPVRFTEEGDRADPHYRVMNWKDGRVKAWSAVGLVGTADDSAEVRLKEICYAGSGPESGCGLPTAPSAVYPVPPTPLPFWVWIIVSSTAVVLCSSGFWLWRKENIKRKLERSFRDLLARFEAMRDIEMQLEGKEQEVEELKQRQFSLVQAPLDPAQTPSTWADTTDTLVEISPREDEYWKVSDRLRETMDDAWISRLWRVQNQPLWIYYCFHKIRLTKFNIELNEREVWHGTSKVDPSVIYNDQQDGFMKQFSRKGLWGHGIYFAERSCYSHKYAFLPFRSSPPPSGRVPASNKDEREIFLAKLLVGEELLMDRMENFARAEEYRELVAPPMDPRRRLRYNTVCGYTDGSKVYAVYENGRGYPDYLVRYYRGERDELRTPFATREDAVEAEERTAEEMSFDEG